MRAYKALILGPVYLSRSETPECTQQRVWRGAELLEKEFQVAGQQYDQGIIVCRIAEIILIDMTRSVLMGQGAEKMGFRTAGPMRGCSTRSSSSSPARSTPGPSTDWHAPGMLLTKFSEEFRKLTGRTPIRTFGCIRLNMSARLLLNETLFLSLDDARARV